jgi:hypothetical protein
MKKLQGLLLAGLVVGLGFRGAAADSESPKKDVATLQGEWSMVSGSADGQPMPESMLKQMKRVCKGDELTVSMGDQTFFKAKITLDPSAKPKTIYNDIMEV